MIMKEKQTTQKIKNKLGLAILMKYKGNRENGLPISRIKKLVILNSTDIKRTW